MIKPKFRDSITVVWMQVLQTGRTETNDDVDTDPPISFGHVKRFAIHAKLNQTYSQN